MKKKNFLLATAVCGDTRARYQRDDMLWQQQQQNESKI